MKNFSIYNFFADSVFVLNDKNKICYTNFAFDDNFAEIALDVTKLSALFDFRACALDTTKIYEFNPILLAMQSFQNYSCSAINVKNGYIYDIFTIVEDKYKIFILKIQDNDIAQIDKKVKELEGENKKFEQLKQQAQSQAIKIGLLNRIYDITQTKKELPQILEASFEELKNVFGIEKLFFATKKDKDYKIEYVFPNKYSFVKNQLFQHKIEENKTFICENYAKEFAFFEAPTVINSTRVIVPINNQNGHLGILSFSLPYKKFMLIDENFLSSLCSQLATIILQAILTIQLKENQLQLINSEKMATLGNMIAAIAHEINTPLGSINSNNELISRLVTNELLKNAQDKTFNMINSIINCDKEAIKRITTIVAALKKFIRLDEANMQLTNVANEIDLTLDLCQHLLKNKVNVIKDYAQVDDIYTHPNMLNQVFMNLIVNAAQSITTKGTITISTQKKNNNMLISIKDTGKGIPDNLKSRIFEQGFTTKTSNDGSGFGLSISKKIIEQLGGTIEFESEENIGTEFRISLPMEQK